jgi:hypothetical protein
MVLKKIPTMEITKHGAIEFNYTDINFNNAIIVWHVCVCLVPHILNRCFFHRMIFGVLLNHFCRCCLFLLRLLDKLSVVRRRDYFKLNYNENYRVEYYFVHVAVIETLIGFEIYERIEFVGKIPSLCVSRSLLL